MDKRVLIVGDGCREHVLYWKLCQSRLISDVSDIYCVPGNGGTSNNINISPEKSNSIETILDFAIEKKIDQTWVCNEKLLVNGIVDVFEKKDLRIIGPRSKAAQLEDSKIFSKLFMKRYDIPIPQFTAFNNKNHGIEHIKNHFKNTKQQIVVKADGLCGRKGVYVCASEQEAIFAVLNLENNCGSAGVTYLLEEKLEGTEVAITIIYDGRNYRKLHYSCTNKRRFDNDKGYSTEGMGAYAPAEIITPELDNIITEKIIKPTFAGLKSEAMSYPGFLHINFMITNSGPKVLEYNACLSYPDAQVIMPLNNADWGEVGDAVIDGKLDEIKWENENRHACCVMAVSGGYPIKFETGFRIYGLEDVKKLEAVEEVVAFHAETIKEEYNSQEHNQHKEENEKVNGNNIKFYTAGGRVLGMTGFGETHEKAVAVAYSAIKLINFSDMNYRRDIGRNILNGKNGKNGFK